jgi:hypothetical protein
MKNIFPCSATNQPAASNDEDITPVVRSYQSRTTRNKNCVRELLYGLFSSPSCQQDGKGFSIVGVERVDPMLCIINRSNCKEQRSMSYLRNNRPSGIVPGGHRTRDTPTISDSSHRGHSGGTILTTIGSSTERSLAEANVDLYNVGGSGTCQIRSSLDTAVDGNVAATGVTFSVQAIGTSLIIQAIEFANTKGSSSSEINIYARKGTSFSTTASDWTTLASTASVASSDGLGMMIPRAAMKQPLTVAAGEVWTIYISSSAANIKLTSTTKSTGSSYQVDSFLQLNVGESIKDGAAFSASRTGNMGFQGKLYYRVLKPCQDLVTDTQSVFPFAATSGIDPTELNNALTTGFHNLLTDQGDLKRWSQVNGLAIKNISLKSKGAEGMSDMAWYGCEFPACWITSFFSHLTVIIPQ